jgi:hypothetical protein
MDNQVVQVEELVKQNHLLLDQVEQVIHLLLVHHKEIMEEVLLQLVMVELLEELLWQLVVLVDQKLEE